MLTRKPPRPDGASTLPWGRRRYAT